LNTLRIPGDSDVGTVDIVFGRVIAIHIADEVMTDGRIDIARIQPLARLGYYEYCAISEVFEMRPPAEGGLAAGLEGSVDKVRLALKP
jgi:hypothetical protein